MDQTLEPNTFFDAVPHWLNPGDCNARYPLFGGSSTAQAAGCSSIFQALAEAPGSFSTAVDSVLAGPFDTATIQAAIDEYKTFLEPHIAASPKDDVTGWTSAVAQLRNDIPALHTKVNALKTV